MQQRVAAGPNWSVNFKMSPRPFVITINNQLFLLPSVPLSFFLFASRTESILRGQPPVRLCNAIIMWLIIGDWANFCLLAENSLLFTRYGFFFNYTCLYIPCKFMKYELVIISSYFKKCGIRTAHQRYHAHLKEFKWKWEIHIFFFLNVNCCATWMLLIFI